ncbi:TPA: hypothetical protein DDW35_07490 [Candidatus Sumerlaeota bacterium]|jgi:hypothetical protein|nr:hypothetical protein [Candidatus Sumerlaeota bacterium]
MNDVPTKSPSPKAISRLRKRQAPTPPSRNKTLLMVGLIFLALASSFIFSHRGENTQEFIKQLYSPVVAIIIFFLALEYIILKGRDRSRVLHIELEQAREKRQSDLEFLRKLDSQLLHMQNKLHTLETQLENAESNPPQEIQQHVRVLRESIAELQSDLAARF